MVKIAPLAGAAWGADILTGQREFPVYKGKKGEGFKEILDKEIERLKGEKREWNLLIAVKVAKD